MDRFPPLVRLVQPGSAAPCAPGREVVFARVDGGALEACGIQDGDHVLLDRREAAEHGDLAAVLDDEGGAALWKVYPEGDRLRLSVGRPGLGRLSAPDPRILGVVVAVLRRMDP